MYSAITCKHGDACAWWWKKGEFKGISMSPLLISLEEEETAAGCGEAPQSSSGRIWGLRSSHRRSLPWLPFSATTHPQSPNVSLLHSSCGITSPPHELLFMPSVSGHAACNRLLTPSAQTHLPGGTVWKCRSENLLHVSQPFLRGFPAAHGTGIEASPLPFSLPGPHLLVKCHFTLMPPFSLSSRKDSSLKAQGTMKFSVRQEDIAVGCWCSGNCQAGCTIGHWWAPKGSHSEGPRKIPSDLGKGRGKVTIFK